MASKDYEYDWLEEAFNDKPSQKQSEQKRGTDPHQNDWLDDAFDESSVSKEGMGKGTKKALGCGCLVVIVLLVFLAFLFGSALSQLS